HTCALPISSRKQFPETFPATCDSISSQSISLTRIIVKRLVRFLLLASTPALSATMQQASAMQSASPNTANSAQPQAANQASSHDRHHRKHSSAPRHHHHHKSATQH